MNYWAASGRSTWLSFFSHKQVIYTGSVPLKAHWPIVPIIPGSSAFFWSSFLMVPTSDSERVTKIRPVFYFVPELGQMVSPSSYSPVRSWSHSWSVHHWPDAKKSCQLVLQLGHNPASLFAWCIASKKMQSSSVGIVSYLCFVITGLFQRIHSFDWRPHNSGEHWAHGNRMLEVGWHPNRPFCSIRFT